MPLIHEDYGYLTYTRVARKQHRCTHWRRCDLLDGAECGALILPGEPYVESVAAPYCGGPYYREVREPGAPWWREPKRVPCWHHARLCLRCAVRELYSFTEVRALATAEGITY